MLRLVALGRKKRRLTSGRLLMELLVIESTRLPVDIGDIWVIWVNFSEYGLLM